MFEKSGSHLWCLFHGLWTVVWQFQKHSSLSTALFSTQTYATHHELVLHHLMSIPVCSYNLSFPTDLSAYYPNVLQPIRWFHSTDQNRPLTKLGHIQTVLRESLNPLGKWNWRWNTCKMYWCHLERRERLKYYRLWRMAYALVSQQIFVAMTQLFYFGKSYLEAPMRLTTPKTSNKFKC